MTKMKFRFVFPAALLFFLVNSIISVNAQTVVLKKQLLPSNGKLEGITNIFFQKTEDQKIDIGKQWKNLEIASVIENKELVPIKALRYQASSGEINYLVDTDGDRSFNDETQLNFRPNGEVQVADVLLKIKRIGEKGTSFPVNYQIITSKDGYVYARIAEFRRGEIMVSGKSFAIYLKPASRNTPLYDLSPATTFMIDLNQNQDFSLQWKLTDANKILPSEEFNLSQPFKIGEDKFRVIELDALGKRLKIAATTEEVSLAVGFKSPAFNFKGLDGNVYDSSNLKGKTILLEFWAVSCPFCKQILPHINLYLEKNKRPDLIALATSREITAEEIKPYLEKNPKQSTVVLYDKAAWQIFNQQMITPTYYIIDKDGIVRFSGKGASPELIDVMDAILKML
jgi:thiol-disulfide isomerase/thioredoxin